MESSFLVTDKTYNAIQNLFVGATPSKTKACPSCRCLNDFFANLWDNKGTLLGGALIGSLALVTQYYCDQPLTTGVLIGCSATLMLIALGNSLHLREAAPYPSDSNNSTYLYIPKINSTSSLEGEQFKGSPPSAGHSHLLYATSPSAVYSHRLDLTPSMLTDTLQARQEIHNPFAENSTDQHASQSAGD